MISVVACAAEGSEIRAGVAERHCGRLFTYLIMQLFTHSIIRSCSHTRSYVSVVMVERLGERWGAGVETQKNVRGEIGGWGRVPFNEPYAPSLSTIYDGA